MTALWNILSAHPEANWVGVLCVFLAATWPLYKTRQGMLWAQAAVHVSFSLHFYLLDALSGSLMNVLAFAQVLAAIPLGKSPGFKKLYIAILPVIAIAAAMTWQGLSSLFAAFGFTMLSLARYQTDTFSMRLLMVVTILGMAIHDYLVLSLPALSADALSLTTSLIMIQRELRERRALQLP
jgi:hypothetical protein